MGYRTIANDLNRRHVESPSGGKWSHDAVRLILIRETYCGTLTLGGRKQGKYFTTDNEQVTAVSGNQPRRTTPVRVEGTHPAIISRKLFDAVQVLRTSQPKPHWRQGSEGRPSCRPAAMRAMRRDDVRAEPANQGRDKSTPTTSARLITRAAAAAIVPCLRRRYFGQWRSRSETRSCTAPWTR